MCIRDSPAGWSSARTYRTTSGTFITPNLPSPVTYQVVCRAVQDDVYYTGYNSAAPYSYDYVSAPYVVGTRAGSMCSCNSGANSCGLRNQGLIPCGSTQACSAPVPDDASCTIPTVGVGGSTGIPGGTPTGSLPGVGTTDSGTLGRIPGSVDSTATAGPPAISQTVGKGGQCVVTFDATPATACMVTAPGFSRLYGPNGTFVSPRMGVDTSGSVTYILSCYNGKSVKASVTKKIVCTLNPNFLEVLDR